MKKISKLRIVLLLPVVVLLAACSGIPLKERQAAERDRYHRYAGSPVESFTHFGRFDGWTPIDKYEFVVWTDINDAYLITVVPACEDIMFTNRIGLTQTGNRVSQKFDSVKVGHTRCMIKSIQPVDYRQMKKDIRQKSEEDKADKPE